MRLGGRNRRRQLSPVRRAAVPGLRVGVATGAAVAVRPGSSPAGSRGDSPPPPVRRVTSWTGGGAIALVVVVARRGGVVRTRPYAGRARRSRPTCTAISSPRCPREPARGCGCGTSRPARRRPDPCSTRCRPRWSPSYSVNPGWVGLTSPTPAGESVGMGGAVPRVDRPAGRDRAGLARHLGFGRRIHERGARHADRGLQRRIEVEKWYVTAREHDDRYRGDRVRLARGARRRPPDAVSRDRPSDPARARPSVR